MKIKKTGKWTYKTIAEAIVREKIGSRTGLFRVLPGAYQAARKNGWLEKLLPTDLRSGKTIGYRFVWTRGMCESAAKGYSSVRDFRLGCYGAYIKSVRNGWLKSFGWLSGLRKSRGYWSRERCLNEALKYRTFSGLRKGCPVAYNTAYRKGWSRDFFWFSSGRKCRGLKLGFGK